MSGSLRAWQKIAMNVRLNKDVASAAIKEKTPKMQLEIRGALIFTGILLAMTVLAAVSQYLGGNSIAHIMPTTLAYLLCAALGFTIFLKKRKGKNADGLSWLVAFLLTAFALFARYNYALKVDWQYAVEGIHINAVVILSLVVLQFLYRKTLYIIFYALVFINWILFLYLAYQNGVPMYMEGIVNGVAQHGRVVILVQGYYLLMMIILGYINYKNIPVIEDFDRLTSIQKDTIAEQAEEQKAMAAEVKNKMIDLFARVNDQNEELAEFNTKLQGQVSTFEEISATVEELSSTSERIQEVSADQVEANSNMEFTMKEFFDIKNQTKDKLRSSLDTIDEVVKKITLSDHVLSNVENSIIEIKGQSEKISGLTNLIVEIAERINLLSLNASIEAARAGHHGRGFAVVASEIGKMATQTAESIKQIEDVMGQSRNITEHGVNTIKEASENVKAMMSQVLESTQKINSLRDNIFLEEKFLEGIEKQMQMNIRLSRETGNGVREQTVALENTNKAIENLNSEVAAMADGINRIAASVAQISDNARSLIKKTEHTIQ